MRVYVDKEDSDFTDFMDEDVPPNATFTLDTDDKKAGKTTFDLLGHTFRNVNCISVFFVDVAKDEDDDELGESCFINRIQLFGNVGKNYHTQY